MLKHILNFYLKIIYYYFNQLQKFLIKLYYNILDYYFLKIFYFFKYQRFFYHQF